jgi:hypothetical protein
MDRYFISKCDHPQVATIEFSDGSPKTEPILFLWFYAYGILNDPHTPVLLQIGPLP